MLRCLFASLKGLTDAMVRRRPRTVNIRIIIGHLLLSYWYLLSIFTSGYHYGRSSLERVGKT